LQAVQVGNDDPAAGSGDDALLAQQGKFGRNGAAGKSGGLAEFSLIQADVGRPVRTRNC